MMDENSTSRQPVLTTAPIPSSKGDESKSSTLDRFVSSAIVTLLMTIALLGAFAGYGMIRYGSVAAGIASLRGSSVYVDEPLKVFDHPPIETLKPLNYRVTNLTGHPIRILGTSASCTCAVVGELPRSIDPGKTIVVNATIKLGGANPPARGSIRLFTDEETAIEVILAFSVRANTLDSP